MRQDSEHYVDSLFSQEQVPRPDFDAMWQAIEQRLAQAGPTRDTRPGFSGKLKYGALAIVSTCLLTVSIGAYVSPTFAEYIKSLFDRKDADAGLQTAAQQGFSQETKAAVTDQGITMQVMEAMADPTRLVLTVGLTKNGEQIDASKIFDKHFANSYGFLEGGFYVTDAAGNLVAERIDDVYSHAPYADLVFRVNRTLDTNELVAHLRMKKIGETAGAWKLTVPVNMEKSMMATKVVPVEKTYKTAQGAIVKLKNIVFSPTATRVEVETDWTEEVKARVAKERSGYFVENVLYHIEDEKGNVIASSSDKADTSLQPILKIRDQTIDSGSRQRFHDNYVPLPADQKLTFVLESIDLAFMEESGPSVTFNPQDLAKKPAALTYRGNTFTVSGFTLEQGKEAQLEMQGTGGSTYAGSWKLLDDKGNAYQLESMLDGRIWSGIGEDSTSGKSKRTIYGLDHAPKRLTLKLEAMIVRDDKVDWRVPVRQ